MYVFGTTFYRYTNVTKIMFLAFWYCTIYPGGLFFASVALAVNYYTDRFSLMRTWKRAPNVGQEVAVFSRQYFLSTACVFLVFMSSFYWSAFPFDNLCPTEEDVGNVAAEYAGSYKLNGIDEVVTVEDDSNVWQFCNQDFILRGFDYPGVAEYGAWMTEEQRLLSKLFGWTSIVVITLVLLKIFLSIILKLKKDFVSDFVARKGRERGFHDCRTIAGYVPQVRSNMFTFPLIACSTSLLGHELFDWYVCNVIVIACLFWTSSCLFYSCVMLRTDPDRGYNYYDLTLDAQYLLTDTTPADNSFDKVQYWPRDQKRAAYLKRRYTMIKEPESFRNNFNSRTSLLEKRRRGEPTTSMSLLLNELKELEDDLSESNSDIAED